MSNTVESYEDIRGFLDQALASERGVKIEVGYKGKAISMRQRMYKLRTLDRKFSTQMVPFGDPKWGKSAYDCLMVDVQELDGKAYVLIKKGMSDLKVEDL